MDGKRFDDLSRLLSRSAIRRLTLEAALAALLGAGALAAGVDEAAAAPKPRRTTCRPWMAGCTADAQCCSGLCDRRRVAPRNRRNRCVCPDGTTPCSGACVDLADSLAHCGACNVACDPETADNCDFDECLCGDESACVNGEICVSGVCESPVASCEPADGADGCFVGVDGATIQVCDGTVIDAECDTAAECTAACAAANIPLPECGCTVGFNDGTGFISADSLTGGALTKAGICGVYLPFDGTCAPPPG